MGDFKETISGPGLAKLKAMLPFSSGLVTKLHKNLEAKALGEKSIHFFPAESFIQVVLATLYPSEPATSRANVERAARLKEIHAHFAEMYDNEVSFEDLCIGLARLAPEEDARAVVHMIFSMYDTDDNGLQIEELSEFLEHTLTFNNALVTGSGALTAAEIGFQCHQQSKAMLEELDIDGDRTVSKEEFEKWYRSTVHESDVLTPMGGGSSRRGFGSKRGGGGGGARAPSIMGANATALAAAALAGDGPSEVGVWTERFSKSQQRAYWTNNDSGEAVWKDPTGGAAAAAALATLDAGAQKMLPAGWVAKLDQKSNTTYYYNTSTGATSWQYPTVSSVVGHHAAEEWVATMSKSAGRNYWTHKTTGETTWDDPTSGTVAAASAAWTEHKDPSSGQAFWMNKQTGETTWDNPG